MVRGGEDSVGPFGLCQNQKNHRCSSFPQPYRQAGCLASAFPSSWPPSQPADTRPSNACVCGLLPASPSRRSRFVSSPSGLLGAVSFHPCRDYSESSRFILSRGYSEPSRFIPVGTTRSRLVSPQSGLLGSTGDTPQTLSITARLPPESGPSHYRYLTFPVVFSVGLANSRVSIAGSSCATLRLLSPSAC